MERERGRGEKNPRNHFQHHYYREKETTFFIENLPDGVSNTMLWKAFTPHGIVSDAYVAKKKDSRGNAFGFVRLVRVRDPKEAVSKMNMVTIKEAKVTVSLAKYVKNQSRNFESRGMGSHRSVNGRTEEKKEFNPGWRKVGLSYRDALRRKETQASNSTDSKSVAIEDEGSAYPIHCVGRSIMGVAKSLQALQEAGFTINKSETEVGISYVGGTRMLITCRDHYRAKDLLLRNKQAWGEFFTMMEIWNGEEFPNEKIMKLSIAGLPLQLRDDTIYNKVGALFGKVVGPADFSWHFTNNATGSCMVLAPFGKRIDEEVTVKWRNRNFKAWVREESELWCPEFEDAIPHEDLEEGEIRSEEIPAENSDQKVTMEEDQKASQRSPNRLGLPRVLHGKEAHHGEQGISKKDIYGPSFVFNSAGTTDKGNVSIEENPFVLGHQTPTGPNKKFILGKRNRNKRSPPSFGSCQGPVSKLCVAPPGDFPNPFDLNSPAPVETPNLEIPLKIPLDPSSDIKGVPLEVAKDGGEDETHEATGAPSGSPVVDKEVDLEVDATIQLGEIIGINLHGFESKVKELINGEGGVNVSQ